MVLKAEPMKEEERLSQVQRLVVGLHVVLGN